MYCSSISIVKLIAKSEYKLKESIKPSLDDMILFKSDIALFLSRFETACQFSLFFITEIRIYSFG